MEKTANTFWARIYIAGPIEVAKQIIRREAMRKGLCVTIEKTCYVYTGGEEDGYVVGLNNYPRFPENDCDLSARAMELAEILRSETYQKSYMVQLPQETIWRSIEVSR